MVWVISGSDTTRGVAGTSAGTGDGIWMVRDGDGSLGAIGEETTTGVGGEIILEFAGCTSGRTIGVVRLTGSGVGGLPGSCLVRLTGSGLGGKRNETLECL